ncbi:MAG: hypothetical protein AAGI28_00895 [Pseudomonadota bacterium]
MKRVRRGVPSYSIFGTHCDWRAIEVGSTGLDAAYIVTRGNHPQLELQVSRLLKEVASVFVLYSEMPALGSSDIAKSISFLRFDESWLADTPSLASTPWCREVLRRNFSIPYKRNFAINHARVHGFRHILLIDDDINFREGLGRRAKSMLANGATAYGTFSLYHPDISITDMWVHRERGSTPPVSISGNCVAIDVHQPLSFFPEVYNEDWLFFQALVELQGGHIAAGENVVQMPPRHKSVEQAKFQQFGEVLADCLTSPAIAYSPTLFDLTIRRHVERSIGRRQRLLKALEIKWEGLSDLVEEIRSNSADELVEFASEFIEKNATAW